MLLDVQLLPAGSDTSGEDMCYGFGRVDALRAVQGNTNYESDPNVTGCPYYPAP